MGFQKVLERAIRGCGISPEQFYASVEYTTRLAQQRKLQRELHNFHGDKKSPRYLALRYGALQIAEAQRSTRGNLSKIASPLTDAKPIRFEAKRRAEILALGDWLIKVAQQGLPDKMKTLAKRRIKDRGLDAITDLVDGATGQRMEELGLSKEMTEIRSGVKIHKERLRLSKGLKIMKTLAKKFPTGSLIHQRELPQEGWVLPAEYSLTDESKLRPNCLGLAIMSAAFIELCGGRSVAFTSTSPMGIEMMLAAELVYKVFAKYGKRYPALKYVHPKAQATARLAARQVKAARAEPLFFHGSAGLYRPEFSQIELMDTNLKEVIPRSFNPALAKSMNDTVALQDVAPGFAQGIWCEEPIKVGKFLAKRTAEILDEMDLLIRLAYEPGITYGKLLRAVAELMPTLARVLPFKTKGDATRKLFGDPLDDLDLPKEVHVPKKPKRQQAAREEYARVVLAYMLMRIQARKRPKAKRESAGATKAKAEAMSAREIQQMIQDTARRNGRALPRLARWLVSYMYAKLVIGAERRITTINNLAGPCISIVGDTRWQFASHVLAHLAVVQDEWRAVFPLLSRHTESVLLQYGHAMTLLENKHDELAVSAAKLVVPKSTRPCLKSLGKELQARGILTGKEK